MHEVLGSSPNETTIIQDFSVLYTEILYFFILKIA